ncbi:alpha,alpha-trehalase TreF [Acetobacter sp. DsW_063]|uniref:alpha,alpha-trehalase TreF n=1 Tax=Acetobacter sp. DsW_063 TaxID=1514894 RepID=UPI001E283866|nr:alpha,alpha-trehalase TreF [Acetobacter sp. DsW_063]
MTVRLFGRSAPSQTCVSPARIALRATLQACLLAGGVFALDATLGSVYANAAPTDDPGDARNASRSDVSATPSAGLSQTQVAPDGTPRSSNGNDASGRLTPGNNPTTFTAPEVEPPMEQTREKDSATGDGPASAYPHFSSRGAPSSQNPPPSAQDDEVLLIHPTIIPAPQSTTHVDAQQDLRPPSIALDGLFAAIGQARIFTDAKAAADAYPNHPPSEILKAWREQREEPGFDLKTFVATYFTTPEFTSAAYQRTPGENVRDYISGMWSVLTREPDRQIPWSSQLPLPKKYVVPGGRFSEIYYWDSYFTMIGLYEDGRIDLMRSTLEDLASLIDRYGHIPNGSRTYYLSRSQPAFFAIMLDLLAGHDGQVVYTRFLPELQREYDYWTDGASTLEPGHAWRHAVRLPDGALMVRPWDDLDTPRDESYPEDIATAASTSRPSHEVWRDLRAGAETGWDYSARWLADHHTLSTIHTTDLVTIEMNCTVAHLAQTLAHAYELAGDQGKAIRYGADAKARVAAIRKYLWDPEREAFYDYDWKKGERTDVLSAATAMPLFLHLATDEQAHAVAHTLRTKLLKVGGLVATDITSGQQWDAPNGWAPLQWMAVKGLNQYGEEALAEDIARRWMARVIGTYEKSGVLLEKYDVVAPEISPTGGAGGGEYPMQIGFGWTNGTLLGLMNRYPRNARQVLDRNPLSDQMSKAAETSGGAATETPSIKTEAKPTLENVGTPKDRAHAEMHPVAGAPPSHEARERLGSGPSSDQ